MINKFENIHWQLIYLKGLILPECFENPEASTEVEEIRELSIILHSVEYQITFKSLRKKKKTKPTRICIPHHWRWMSRTSGQGHLGSHLIPLLCLAAASDVHPNISQVPAAMTPLNIWRKNHRRKTKLCEIFYLTNRKGRGLFWKCLLQTEQHPFILVRQAKNFWFISGCCKTQWRRRSCGKKNFAKHRWQHQWSTRQFWIAGPPISNTALTNLQNIIKDRTNTH